MNEQLSQTTFDTVANRLVAQQLTKPQIEKITIEPLSSGYVVTVGCQTIAIQSKSILLSKLVEYIEDPLETRRKYFDNTLF